MDAQVSEALVLGDSAHRGHDARGAQRARGRAGGQSEAEQRHDGAALARTDVDKTPDEAQSMESPSDDSAWG